MKRTVGNWVEGDRFWNRTEEIALFVELLDEEANLLLVAQRRIGKTSLMREVALRISDQYICLQVDLESANSPADAIAEISAATRAHKSLWEKTKDIFRNIVNAFADKIDTLQVDELKVTLRSGLAGEDWQSKGDRLFTILAASDKPVVIFLDEVPILVNRMLKGDDFQITPERRRQADAFMSWLRENSLRHQGKVRLVVTGSIGLGPVLKQAGLSATINHFTPFSLDPWRAEVAKSCVEALAGEYDLTFEPEAIQDMIAKLGVCIPYHVQMFFDQIYQTCRLQGLKQVNPELVQVVYDQKMLSTRGHAELSHLEERLKLVLGAALHPLALDLLTEAAVLGELTAEAAQILYQEYARETDHPNPQTVLQEVLNILEHDGYLERKAEVYGFVSKLIQDWWKSRYGFHFVPAAQRLGV